MVHSKDGDGEGQIAAFGLQRLCELDYVAREKM